MINALSHIMPAIWTSDQGSYFLYSSGGSIPVILTIILFLIFGFAVFVLVLWIIMPFSVFGLKGLMRKSIIEQKKTNELLEKMMKAEQDRAVREIDLPEIRPLDDEPRDF